jgi:hypothetical protein
LTLSAQDYQIAKTKEERAALDASNQARYDEIQAIKAAKDAQAQYLASFQQSLAAVKAYISDAMDAQRKQIQDYYAQLDQQAKELNSRQQALFRSLMDYTKSLQLGDMSILNPSQQFELAQANFHNLAAKAANTSLSLSDRVTAAEGLQSASDAYLGAARKMYASSTSYKDVFTEVMSVLDSSKFLGTTKDYDPAPIQNAMLAELEKLNSQVGVLPAGIASSLVPMMANLITMGLSSGLSKEQIANTAIGLGPAAVAAADTFLANTSGGTVEDYATKPETMRAYADALRGQVSTESEYVHGIVAKAQEYHLSAHTVGQALGYTDDQVADFLKKYGIPMFAQGGYHSGGWMLAGEQGPELINTGPARIYNASDTRVMLEGKGAVVELQALRKSVDRLAAIATASADFGGRQMQDQNELLGSIDSKLASNKSVGSARYANGRAA